MKRKAFKEAVGERYSSNSTSKFVTTISKSKKYSNYSFGFKFFYHEYYRNIHTPRDPVGMFHGHAVHEDGNIDIDATIKISEWFVDPIHKNIKSEVLCAKHCITMKQWR